MINKKKRPLRRTGINVVKSESYEVLSTLDWNTTRKLFGVRILNVDTRRKSA
jgi:hypothetical protein